MITIKIAEPHDDAAAIIENASKGEFVLVMPAVTVLSERLSLPPSDKGPFVTGIRHDGVYPVGPYDVTLKRVARPAKGGR